MLGLMLVGLLELMLVVLLVESGLLMESSLLMLVLLVGPLPPLVLLVVVVLVLVVLVEPSPLLHYLCLFRLLHRRQISTMLLITLIANKRMVK